MSFYSLVFNVGQTFRQEEIKKMGKKEGRKERKKERKRKKGKITIIIIYAYYYQISGRVSSISVSTEIDLDTCFLPVFTDPILSEKKKLQGGYLDFIKV